MNPQLSPSTIRTKIVATLGPATNDPSTLRALLRAGVNVVRLNFSHGTHAEHAARIAMVRSVAQAEGLPIAVLQDLQGPRLRVLAVAEGTVLVAGQAFVFDGRRGTGDRDGVGIGNFHRLLRAIRPGERILIDDGKIECVVRDVRQGEGQILAEVVTGGELKSHKGLNLPDTTVNFPSLTDKDRQDVAFGLAHGVDFMALSFVSTPVQVRTLKKLIRRLGGDVPVIAKIERREAVVAIEAILAEADGVMVARGDLALQIGEARVPVLQKQIIRQANVASKPVITATQMLESMIYSPKPTRAETSDVANAILDGTDAVMLSGETAAGRYPVQAVAAMVAVARETEPWLAFPRLGRRPADPGRESVTQAISGAAVEIARSVNAPAIIAVTSSGQTARAVAYRRPECLLVGATRHVDTWRRLALVWGVVPLLVGEYATADEMVHVVGEAAEAHGLVRDGDLVVVTSGQPVGRAGRTNMVQVRRAGDWRAADGVIGK